MNTTAIRKGDIFFVGIEKAENSRIQSGNRPVLIVSNNICNKYSPTIHYVPLTGQVWKKRLPTHVQLSGCGLSGDSIALCEQATILDVLKLGRKVGVVSQEVLEQIDKALAVQFGFCA